MAHIDNIIWNNGERVFVTGSSCVKFGGRFYEVVILTGYKAGAKAYLSARNINDANPMMPKMVA